MTFEILNRGDERRHGVLADTETWLRTAGRLYDPFLDRVGQSPFFFHEVACAGFLASAAAVAGFIPLTEYAVVKRDKGDLRRKYDGRARLLVRLAPTRLLVRAEAGPGRRHGRQS